MHITHRATLHILSLGALLAAAQHLSGCSSAAFGEQYGPRGGFGIGTAYGYEDSPLGADSYLVTYYGGSQENAVAGFKRRALERCKESGFSSFDAPDITQTMSSGDYPRPVLSGTVTCSNSVAPRMVIRTAVQQRDAAAISTSPVPAFVPPPRPVVAGQLPPQAARTPSSGQPAAVKDVSKCADVVHVAGVGAFIQETCGEHIAVSYCVDGNPRSNFACTKRPFGLKTLKPWTREAVPGYLSEGGGSVMMAACPYPKGSYGWSGFGSYSCR